MKIVLNKSYGGFGVSKAVYKELGIKWDGYGYLNNKHFEIEAGDSKKYRTDLRLITAIEKIGVKNSSNGFESLEIVEIPDDVEWEIDNYNGIETVHEVHRSW